jgi:ABC-type Mn2+/Zn2+ transport system ATPase subunit
MLALSVRNLTVRYEGQSRPVLDDVSLDLDEGSIGIVIGPNGSGKSTLVKAVLGLTPSQGDVLVFGEPAARATARIGYVAQRLPFDPTLPLTTREAIRMAFPRRVDAAGEEVFRHSVEILSVEAYLDRPLGALSGGQLKRAMIARALITRPRLLLLDEPEAGIDVEGEETLYQLLEHLVEHERLTVLICSHELELAARYADQIFCLNKRLLCSGTPRQVLTPETLTGLYGVVPAEYHITYHDAHGGPPRGATS